MSLSKIERETILSTSDGINEYSIYTHDRKLKHQLERFAKDYPDCCRLKASDRNGMVTYLVDKSRVSIRLIPPYSVERREQARKQAACNNSNNTRTESDKE